MPSFLAYGQLDPRHQLPDANLQPADICLVWLRMTENVCRSIYLDFFSLSYQTKLEFNVL
jgi:hypothetical protein